MKILNYVKHKPFTINYDDNYTVLDLANLFLETNNVSTIITKDNKPIYIITNTDLINFFLKKEENLQIKELIKRHPKQIITIHKDADIYDAYKQMRGAAIEHLIVVNDEGFLVGEVYHQDLVIKFVEFALKDELTGLNNPRFLETIIQRYNGSHSKIGVIFIDIDNFKIFNDKFGHQAGDEVLKLVSNTLQKSIREMDFAFRYGGDEFVVMIFEQPREIVLKIAYRIFDKITSQDTKYGKIGVSIGVAIYPEDNQDLQEVIKLADKELYIAKNSGKGKIESIN
jgi:diguanylate cyclase (GGDEF)-like protein